MRVVWQQNIKHKFALAEGGFFKTRGWHVVKMTGLLWTSMTLKSSGKRKEEGERSFSFGVQSLGTCLFVCELIGCRGLWTKDLCSFRLMLHLEHDSGSKNVPPVHWHGLASCVTTSSLIMLSSSASPPAPRATNMRSGPSPQSRPKVLSGLFFFPTEMHLNQVCDSYAYMHAMNINAESEAAEEWMKKKRAIDRMRCNGEGRALEMLPEL